MSSVGSQLGLRGLSEVGVLLVEEVLSGGTETLIYVCADVLSEF